MKRLGVVAGLAALLVFGADASAAERMDPALREKAMRAADEGLHFLRESQAEDGSWAGSVGVTALGLRAFLENRRDYNESDGAFITRPVAYLLAHVNEDGSISETNQNRAYNTAVVLSALSRTENSKYAEAIRNGQNYLKGVQLGPEDGYEADHKYYGGIGYGGDERPDLSNQYMALEALKSTAVDPQDPVWERALVFVGRSQNRSESNDQDWAANDGGFTYMPGYSPHGGTGSYGGMTHAGLLSLLFAGVDRNDPRVKAAHDWIRANYTLDENPGAKDNGGLFYYYNAFAKCMFALGEDEITDSSGATHNWRNDLVSKLLSMQGKDGSWANPYSDRWWEGEKSLVTAWAVIALNYVIREP